MKTNNKKQEISNLKDDSLTIRKRENIIIQACSDMDLRKDIMKACEEGNLKTLMYLLSPKNLNSNAVLLMNSKQFITPFIKACQKGHLDIVQFLLKSAVLKIKVEVHLQVQEELLNIFNDEKLNHIANYLIFDYQLFETEEISQIRKLSNNLDKGLMVRDMQIKLEQKLQPNKLDSNSEKAGKTKI